MSSQDLVIRWGLYGAVGLLLGCGVRGDPMAPGYPAELGRGRPTYQSSDYRLKVPPLPGAEQIRLEEEEERRKDEGGGEKEKKPVKKAVEKAQAVK